MSEMPDDIKSKYNHDNKFLWVDAQLEKYMDRQKKLEKKIVQLEIENANLKDRLVELGDNPNQLGLFEENYDN